MARRKTKTVPDQKTAKELRKIDQEDGTYKIEPLHGPKPTRKRKAPAKAKFWLLTVSKWSGDPDHPTVCNYGAAGPDLFAVYKKMLIEVATQGKPLPVILNAIPVEMAESPNATFAIDAR